MRLLLETPSKRLVFPGKRTEKLLPAPSISTARVSRSLAGAGKGNGEADRLPAPKLCPVSINFT